MRQSVLLRYESSQACRLSVRLLLAFRYYHSLSRRNDGLSLSARFEDGRVSLAPYVDQPPVTILHSGGSFVPETKWYFNNEYLRELERGLDFKEDLYSPGSLAYDFEPGHAVWFIATLEPELLYERPDVDLLLKNEKARRTFRRRWHGRSINSAFAGMMGCLADRWISLVYGLEPRYAHQPAALIIADFRRMKTKPIF